MTGTTLQDVEEFLLRRKAVAPKAAVVPINWNQSWHQRPYQSIPAAWWIMRVWWQQMKFLAEDAKLGLPEDRARAYARARAFVREEDEQASALGFQLT